MNWLRGCVVMSSLYFALGGVAYGDLNLVSRMSVLSVDYQFGFVGGTNSGRQSIEETSIASNMNVAISGADSGEGPLGDTAWIASYQFALDQGISVANGAVDLYGNTSLFTFRADQGVATLSAQPGNNLELEFDNTTEGIFNLSVSLTSGARLKLEQRLKNDWLEVFYGIGTSFPDQQIALGEGRFRFSASGDAYSDGFSSGESWSARIAPVPEPATLCSALFLLFAHAIYARRISCFVRP